MHPHNCSFVTLNVNIVFNTIMLVVDIPCTVQDVHNATQMSELYLILLWTALLHPGTRSVPTNFNQTWCLLPLVCSEHLFMSLLLQTENEVWISSGSYERFNFVRPGPHETAIPRKPHP
jgi:hypothetical protein